MEKLFKISCSKLGTGFFFALMLSGCGGGGTSTGLDVPITAYTPGTLTSISISPPSTTVGVGSVTSFTATGTLFDGSTVNLTNQVTWTSSDSTIAAISSAGVVNALLTGSASIGARLGSYFSNTTVLTVSAQATAIVTGPLAGVAWTYYSPSGSLWSLVTDSTVPNGGTVYKAATILDSQYTTGSATVNLAVAGNVSFYYKVSSEAGYDYLVFSIDGVAQNGLGWSGTVPWTLASYPITAGSHTLTWKYVKDYAVSSGSDTAWLSQVTVPLQLVNMGGAMQGKPLVLSTAVSTLAGTGVAGFADSNNGLSAIFNKPDGIATDGINLYVADSLNNKIRQLVIASGAVTSLAGSATGTAGSADGTGTAATFTQPVGITTDGSNLYVADSGNNRIRRVGISTGLVTTVAGSATAGSADGTGTAATFSGPEGVTTDGTNLYVADTANNKIRKIVLATGAVTTLAGSATGALGSADGTGTAATFSGPKGITTDGTNLYVADNLNNAIRKIQ